MNIRSLQKHFLAGAMVIGMVLNSQAQFTITGTSVTFTGHTPSTATDFGQFYTYQAYANPMYLDNGCTTAATASDVGGFDANAAVYDATQAVPPHADGVIYYGGGIRNVYFDEDWGACANHSPSFGFHTGDGGGIANGSDVDLSDPANQKIQFTYQSDVDLDLELQLLDASYATKLNSVPVSLVGDNSPHTILIDFSSDIAGGADMTNIRQVSLIYLQDVKSPNFQISLSNIQLGSSVVTGTSKANENIASSVVYPNPSSEGNATVDLKLKTVSDVKITLSDLMGKEVAVIAEEKTASLSKPFSVEGLVEGVYTVNYYINGAPAKSELLMVK